jgi:hypothetical protein
VEYDYSNLESVFGVTFGVSFLTVFLTGFLEFSSINFNFALLSIKSPL